MTLKLRPRLSVNQLEERETPSASLVFSGGSLTIRGDNTPNNLTLDGAGAVTVKNNAATLGTYNVTGGVTILMGNSADTVALGSTAAVNIPGSLSVTTGNGDDVFTAQGRVGGNVTVASGLGNDSTGLTAFTAGGPSVRFDGGPGTDTFTTAGAATLAGTTLLLNQNATTLASGFQASSLVINNVSDTGAAAAALAAGAAVAGSYTYSGGPGSDTVTVDGTVNGSLNVVDMSGANSFTAGATAGVNGNLSLNFGSGNDTFNTTAGAFFGSVNANLGEGDNTYGIDNAFTVFGDFNLRAGNGTNDLTFNGATINGSLNVTFGSGTDSFTFTSGSVGYRTVYRAGAGTNTVTLGVQPSNIVQIYLSGGDSTVDLGAIPDFTGSGTIDFGVGFGSKLYLPPATVSGSLVLLNYP